MDRLFTGFVVFCQEFIEALIASDLDHCDLESVPSVLKERLDVALELGEGVLVLLCALSTDERSKGDVAMRAPVILTINAESVKLLLVDASAQVCRRLGTLGVTFEIRLGQRWVALRLTV